MHIILVILMLVGTAMAFTGYFWALVAARKTRHPGLWQIGIACAAALVLPMFAFGYPQHGVKPLLLLYGGFGIAFLPLVVLGLVNG